MIDPNEDGVSHINVYSKAKTQLGRQLSNFAHLPIVLEDDGEFASIEAYWYWLGTNHLDRDKLRPLYGFQAKALGREFNAQDWHEDDPQFIDKIKIALTVKLQTYPVLLEVLRALKDLPLKHYYVYGDKAVEPKDGRWIMEHMNSLRP